jgi:hypothetical protein
MAATARRQLSSRCRNEQERAVGVVADEHDADALTELFWAAPHGLVTLTRAGRLRPGYDSERLQLLVRASLVGHGTCSRTGGPCISGTRA